MAQDKTSSPESDVTAENSDTSEEVEVDFKVCACGSLNWRTRPSGMTICSDCGRPRERLTVRQPKP